MSSGPPSTREEVLTEILSAKQANIRFFICGLIHNYSLREIDEQTGQLNYLGNPVWEKGKDLSGKRLLEESELTLAVFPDVILLEGEPPEWSYNPKLEQSRREEHLARRHPHSSPNLLEVIAEAEEFNILVKGSDNLSSKYGKEYRQKLEKKMGLAEHYSMGKDLIHFLEQLKKKKSLPEEEMAHLDSFLQSERPQKELSDPNHYYLFCAYLEYFLKEAGPCLTVHLQRHLPRFAKAKKAFRAYIHHRDVLIPSILTDELNKGHSVLLKIGSAHMNREYALLPSHLEKEKIPYYYFLNFQTHTAEEIDAWEQRKSREKSRLGG